MTLTSSLFQTHNFLNQHHLANPCVLEALVGYLCPCGSCAHGRNRGRMGSSYQQVDLAHPNHLAKLLRPGEIRPRAIRLVKNNRKGVGECTRGNLYQNSCCLHNALLEITDFLFKKFFPYHEIVYIQTSHPAVHYRK